MPVWHGLTKELVERGELVVIGITQEQHPDRCALFARWKGLDFPILWDPFNLTGVDAVPVLTAVDEHGIVRLTRPDPRRFQEQIVEGFLGGRFEDEPGRASPGAFRKVVQVPWAPFWGGPGLKKDRQGVIFDG